MPDSWYVASTDIPDVRPALRGQVNADVCIVGAGFTGLSAARHLAAKGLDVVVLDAHRVGFGASGRNGGHVCTGYNTPQRALAAKYGADHARQLWDLAEEAKADIRALCQTDMPEAQYRAGYVEAAAKPGEVGDMHRDAAFLQDSYGYEGCTPLDRDAIRALVKTDDYHGGHFDTGAGHFHPLRFAYGMARLAEAPAPESTKAAKSTTSPTATPPKCARTKRRVNARHVILAGNGYMPNIERKVAAKIMPLNSFIAATEPLAIVRHRCWRKISQSATASLSVATTACQRTTACSMAGVRTTNRLS